MKANPFIPQDDIGTLNNNLESGYVESVTSSRDISHPLSSTCHDSVYHDFLDQSAPPTMTEHMSKWHIIPNKPISIA